MKRRNTLLYIVLMFVVGMAAGSHIYASSEASASTGTVTATSE